MSQSFIEVGTPYRLVRARHGWMLANPNDFYVGNAILVYGECIEIEFRFLSQLLFRPGIVVEMGANIGVHTVPLAKVMETQRREMVVFEPQPFIFQNLCANLALNGISNVKAWPMACAAEEGRVFMPAIDYTAPGNFGGVSVQTEAGLGSNVNMVPCARLDDVLYGDATVSLIKIDVEGSELLALQGAAKTIVDSRPILYVENDRLEKSKALIEWLWEYGYRVFWHLPPLFNPDNFFQGADNIYPNVVSINMLALPEELNIPASGLLEVVDSSFHPFRNR